MTSETIKFKFNTKLSQKKLEDIFDELSDSLNIQFDKNLKPYKANNDNIYDMIDISNLNQETVDNEISSFFSFDFEEIIDVQLYQFLVLKNNEEYTILANINSLIFDYNSINNIYNLFNEKDYKNTSKNILKHYEYSESYLSSSEFETDCEYWKNYLSDSENARKFYNIKSSDYNNIKIPYNNEQLTKFLTDNNLNKSVYFTGIFSLYLSRIDRTNGCILNTVTSNENTDFENKTLLNIRYLKDAPFIDYLNQIKKDYDLASEHTKVDISNYLDEKLSYYSINDLRNFENITILNGEGTALTLNIYDEYIDLIYNKELFTDVYIEHMAANLESLIKNAIKSPNQLCNDVDILSEDEKELISTYSYGGHSHVDTDKTLAVAFRENAQKDPDFIAINDGVNKVSYGEMEKSSNSIAWDLANNYGVTRGDCIALMMPRDYHFPELVIALNKIGATAVPIGYDYPLKRIEHMLNISESKYIIVTSDIAEKFDFPVDVIRFEDLNQTLDVDFEIIHDKNDTFAIFFTSGTTGAPKGVIHSNLQFSGVMTAFSSIMPTNKDKVVGSLASFTFVASYRLYVSLYYGQTCRIINDAEQKDQLLLFKAFTEAPMQDMVIPPFLAEPILRNPNISIDYLLVGGARLDDLDIESETKILNIYAMTEVFPATCNTYELGSQHNHISIGNPFVNLWLYILDEDGNQLPVGVPGEICLSSEYVSIGYVGNPELTSETFIDNPYCENESNKRLYRTGDIGYYNFNGEIEILGRDDDQLSVRGFRVESNEILNIMNSFESIDTVYLDVENETLYAYYTVNDKTNVEDIRDALKSELPSYMVPSVFMELDEIPLNPNGKIDKFALRSMTEKNEPEIDDKVLKTVINGFKEVLNKHNVLIDDEFVALGGNSISAMNLQLYIKNQFNVILSSNKLIELSTPIKISNYIKLASENQVDKLNYNFDEICPLSESQLNVYLDEAANNMETEYNNPFKIELKNKYSFENIERSINKLFEIFPVLSARVLIDNDIPSFIFDVKPQVSEGSIKDIETFVKPFNVEESLTRFLIVEDTESVILCMDFHHLIFDGTSLEIILNALLNLLEGNSVEFIDEGVLRQLSYEENNIDSNYMDDAAKFFKNALADEDETQDLMPSPFNEDTYDYEYVDFLQINNENLNSFLQENLITTNQFFTSAFAYTLSRFTGSDKVLFNLIENGRGHTDLSNSVGMFVRTLPILINCENQNVDSFLKYSSQLVNSTMNYDLYPYRILSNEYELNSEVFFQYSHNIIYDNLNNEFITNIEELQHDLQGDLSIYVFNSDKDEYGIRIIFSDKFDKEFIKQFVDTYKLILNEITHANKLSDINYLSNDELELLNKINNTKQHLKYGDIIEAFNDNLAKHPNNKLVSFENVSYSYSEGAFIADKIFRKLTEMGVDSQDNVAFLVERSELYMFCVLGILSSGAAFVPLDNNYPDDRIQFILNDTDSKVVIVSDETYEKADNLTDIPLLNISDIVSDKGIVDELPVEYSELGCILYTSGTTGVPKGVKVPRLAFENLSEYYARNYGLTSDDVFGMYSSIGFDAAYKTIFASISAGACLDVVPGDIKLDMNALNEYFLKQGINHIDITTQVAKLYLENIDEVPLDVLFTGGEKLGDFYATCDCRFVDGYGPTEGYVEISTIDVNDKIDASSVGTLVDNTKAYVLDSEGRRVPCGAVGELYISGYQVAYGYLNREEETNKAFINNPFENDPYYNLLYRTGDLVRILPDGSLGVVGRSDNQVKIRGNRVELSEVEEVIRELDYIEDVTVQTTKIDANNELVAYVVISEDLDENFVREDITKHTRNRKPDYMIPSFTIILDSIPLNVNGKVDRRALPEIDLISLRAEFMAPRNETEKEIVEAFEKALETENISINDDFIRLGGDSLTGIKVLSYLNNNNITIADILAYRTPEAIAKNFTEFDYEPDIYSLEKGVPLNGAQLNVFADIMVYNKRDAYHIFDYMNIPKEYGLENIINSLKEMIRLHPILKMCMSKEYEKIPTEGFNEKFNLNFGLAKDITRLSKKLGTHDLLDIINSYGITDLKGLYRMSRNITKLLKGHYPYMVQGIEPPIYVESKFSKELVTNFLSKTLDLFNNLAKFMIVETDQSYLLLMSIHHIIFDATSSIVFKDDLQTLLDGGNVDYDEEFLEVSAFSHFIKLSEEFDEASDFFDEMLQNIDEAGELLEDSDNEGYIFSHYKLDFDKKAFKSFLRKTGISENAFFTGIFAYTLSKFVKTDKVLFTIIDNGRDRFINNNFIDMTSNVIPLLIDCQDQSIGSFISKTSETVYKEVKYSYYPILKLYQKYNFEVKILFQFLPDWVNTDIFSEEENLPTLDIVNDIIKNYNDSIADFFVQIYQTDGEYTFTFFNSNKFSEELCTEFKDTFISVLNNIIHMNPKSNLSTVLKEDNDN